MSIHKLAYNKTKTKTKPTTSTTNKEPYLLLSSPVLERILGHYENDLTRVSSHLQGVDARKKLPGKEYR